MDGDDALVDAQRARRRLVDILCSDGLEPRAVRLSDQHRQHLVDMLAEDARPMMVWPR